jgi:hypothetical protein
LSILERGLVVKGLMRSEGVVVNKPGKEIIVGIWYIIKPDGRVC